MWLKQRRIACILGACIKRANYWWKNLLVFILWSFSELKLAWMDTNRRGHLISLYDTTSADTLPLEKSNGQELWRKIREAIYFRYIERCTNHAAPFTISESSVESRCIAVGVLKWFLAILVTWNTISVQWMTRNYVMPLPVSWGRSDSLQRRLR